MINSNNYDGCGNQADQADPDFSNEPDFVASCESDLVWEYEDDCEGPCDNNDMLDIAAMNDLDDSVASDDYIPF